MMSGKKKKRSRSRSSSSKRSSSRKKSPKAAKAEKIEQVDSESEDEVGPDEFLVKLTMKGKGLGVEVDWANGKSLLVKSVKPVGAVPDWNQEHPPDQTVMAEDHILAVNGKAGDPKAMLNECRTSKKLKLLVWAHCARSSEVANKAASKPAPDQRRLADAEAQLQESLARVSQKRRGLTEISEFLVSLDMRRHTVLGLDVDWTNGKLLYIKGLQPGAIEEWNRVSPADRTVQPGDTLVAVNGYAGDARGMAGLAKELCTAQTNLQLRVRGPPPPPSNSAPKLMLAT